MNALLAKPYVLINVYRAVFARRRKRNIRICNILRNYGSSHVVIFENDTVREGVQIVRGWASMKWRNTNGTVLYPMNIGIGLFVWKHLIVNRSEIIRAVNDRARLYGLLMSVLGCLERLKPVYTHQTLNVWVNKSK